MTPGWYNVFLAFVENVLLYTFVIDSFPSLFLGKATFHVLFLKCIIVQTLLSHFTVRCDYLISTYCRIENKTRIKIEIALYL